MIGPDLYSDDPTFAMDVIKTYHRADNPLWIPEVARADSFSRYFFYSLGEGALAFAPFGIDKAGWNILGDEGWSAHSRNFALIEPIAPQLANSSSPDRSRPLSKSPARHHRRWTSAIGRPLSPSDFRSTTAAQRPVLRTPTGPPSLLAFGPDEFLVTASMQRHLPPARQTRLDAQSVPHRRAGVYERRVEAPQAMEWR